MNAVFIDTSYLLALELANDQNHQTAKTHWQQVVTSLPILVTTSYVFDEVVTYFNSRDYHAKAVQVGNSLLYSPSMQLVYVDEALFYTGWQYFQQYQDKRYSLTDCISFVVMQRRGINVAFTFDKHFVQAGFQKCHEIWQHDSGYMITAATSVYGIQAAIGCCLCVRYSGKCLNIGSKQVDAE